jgi:hypothetical protein
VIDLTGRHEVDVLGNGTWGQVGNRADVRDANRAVVVRLQIDDIIYGSISIAYLIPTRRAAVPFSVEDVTMAPEVTAVMCFDGAFPFDVSFVG